MRRKLCQEWDVHEIIAHRDDGVFETKKIDTIWVPLGEAPIPSKGLMLVPTSSDL